MNPIPQEQKSSIQMPQLASRALILIALLNGANVTAQVQDVRVRIPPTQPTPPPFTCEYRDISCQRTGPILLQLQGTASVLPTTVTVLVLPLTRSNNTRPIQTISNTVLSTFDPREPFDFSKRITIGALRPNFRYNFRVALQLSNNTIVECRRFGDADLNRECAPIRVF